jgi:ubiquitin carboxyl-terminal hydrolase 48
MLSPEELVGDNQYRCDNCGGMCDADRQMRLRSLPPYLCLSLQRFTFDMQVWMCGGVWCGVWRGVCACLA